MSITHHRTCKRPAPVLVRGWTGAPELLCPGCGRTAPAPTPDTPTPNRKD